MKDTDPIKQNIEYLLRVYKLMDEAIGFSKIREKPTTCILSLKDELRHKIIRADWEKFLPDDWERGTLESINEASSETGAVMASVFSAKTAISDKVRKFFLAGLASVIAMYQWGQAKIIYNFNEEISESIMESAGDIMDANFTCLKFLPLKAFYMKFPSIPISEELRGYIKRIQKNPPSEGSMFMDFPTDATIEGAVCYRDEKSGRFYFCMEYSKGYKGSPLITSNSFDRKYINVPIKSALLQKGYLKLDSYEQRLYMQEVFRVLVPHLLYLTAEGAEVPLVPALTAKEAASRPTLENIRTVEVGREFRIRRREFRQMYLMSKQTDETGSMKVPHVRRAHYTRYWYGKRDSDDRQVRLKWIPEIYIHKELMVNMSPTVIDVR